MRIVTVARKPCAASSTTANVVEHEAGAINIDASRLTHGDGGERTGEASRGRRYTERGSTNFAPLPGPRGGDARGRWPANVFIVGTATKEALDAQSGQLTSGSGTVKRASAADRQGNTSASYGAESRVSGSAEIWYGDTGGASRFFKCFEDQSK